MLIVQVTVRTKSRDKRDALKINVTCSGCQRVMRVGQQHLGKKGKCPSCGTINQIQPDPDPSPLMPPAAPAGESEDDIPDGIPVAEPTVSNPFAPAKPEPPSNPNPFAPAEQPQSDLFLGAPLEAGSPLGASSPYDAPSPYQTPQHSGQSVSHKSTSEPDIPGILGVIAGGMSLLGLLLCVCFGPIVIGVVLISIAGLVLSCFGRPPLKAIGIGLNVAALTITLLVIIAGVAFFYFAIQQQPPGSRPW